MPTHTHPTRRLGANGPEITTIGFGAWAIGGGDWAFGWGSQDDRDSIAAIHRALDLPEADWPHPLRVVGRRLTEAQVRRADAIKEVRDAHANRLGIDPSLIAPRTTLLDLAHDWDKNLATLMRWQQALLVP